MSQKNSLTLRHEVEVLRNAFTVVLKTLREAINDGTGQIEDLPAFLYNEYALRWTAYQDLLKEYEKGEVHKAISSRRQKVWSWLQGLPEDASEFENAVEEVGE